MNVSREIGSEDEFKGRNLTSIYTVKSPPFRSKQSIEDSVVDERIDGIKHGPLTHTVLVRVRVNDIDVAEEHEGER